MQRKWRKGRRGIVKKKLKSTETNKKRIKARERKRKEDKGGDPKRIHRENGEFIQSSFGQILGVEISHEASYAFFVRHFTQVMFHQKVHDLGPFNHQSKSFFPLVLCMSFLKSRACLSVDRSICPSITISFFGVYGKFSHYCPCPNAEINQFYNCPYPSASDFFPGQ